MDFFKKLFKRKEEVAGLDIGSSSIKMAQISRNASGSALSHFACCPTPPMTIKDGAIVDARVLGETIAGLMRDGKFTATRLVSGVSGQSVVIRPITMAAMEERELQHAIKFEAEKYLPYAVNEAHISGHILRQAPDGDERNMEVLLVAAPHEMVKNTQEVIKMAQATPEAIDLEPFALLRTLRRGLDPETMKQAIALVSLGASSSSINIFKDGALRHNRTISVAGNSFTKAIGQSLNLSFEEAEKIKKEKGLIRLDDDPTPVAPTTMRIFNVIIPVLNELKLEIGRSFDYYKSRYKGESVDLVILSGGTSRFKNLDQYISRQLSIGVRPLDPFSGLSIQDVEGFTPADLEEMAPIAMVVTGLALRTA